MDLPEYVTHSIESTCSHFLNSIVVPRPIAFITTLGNTGIVNAAPFSYFNAVCLKPAHISVSIERRNGLRKDTACNIFSNKEFVINICSSDMAPCVSKAAQDFPPDVSEIDITGLTLIPSHKIAVPRIARSLVQMECIFKQSIEIEDSIGDLILGQIVNIHLHKSILNEEGQVDFEKLDPLARLSGGTYARLGSIFRA